MREGSGTANPGPGRGRDPAPVVLALLLAVLAAGACAAAIVAIDTARAVYTVLAALFAFSAGVATGALRAGGAARSISKSGPDG